MLSSKAIKIGIFNHISDKASENLRSLERLCIRSGKIVTLPESIGNIISLITLELQYNPLANLPESVGNLTNLESLGVYSIPEDMLYWDYFNNYCPLEFNKITEKRSPFSGLPESASKITSLEYLHLSNTEITALPDYLSDLPAINSGKLRLVRSIEDLELQ